MQKTTRELVFDAAEALLKEGIKPSQQNIRERIGRGSATTIHKALNEWWGSLSARLDHQQQEAKLPEFLSKSLVELWQQALERSRAEVDKEQQLIKESLLEKRKELDSSAEHSRQQTEQIASQLNQAHQRIAELQDRLDQIQKENIELERQIVAESSRSQEQARQIKAQDKIIAQLEKNSAGAGAASKSRKSIRINPQHADKKENLLNFGFEEENQNLKSAIENLDRRLVEREQQLSASQDELLEAKRRFYRLESNADGQVALAEAKLEGQLTAKDAEIERLLALLADKG